MKQLIKNQILRCQSYQKALIHDFNITHSICTSVFVLAISQIDISPKVSSQGLSTYHNLFIYIQRCKHWRLSFILYGTQEHSSHEPVSLLSDSVRLVQLQITHSCWVQTCISVVPSFQFVFKRQIWSQNYDLVKCLSCRHEDLYLDLQQPQHLKDWVW